jgi:molecular chaperone Hsp33
MSDQLSKYLFADRTVRAQTIMLEDTWRAVQASHDYPPVITSLLGELVAASALLSANLKFDGSLVLQLQGDGDVRLIVVECKANLDLRATVKLREGCTLPETGTLQSLLNSSGNGRFTVVLDPPRKQPGQQPYQGVVPLVGDTVAEALEHYMASSEQLQTRLWLAADEQHSAGLLLQQLPRDGGNVSPEAMQQADDEDDTWTRALHLADTLKREELLQTPSATLVHRLFWQEDLIAFDPQGVRFHCPCSREKVADVLRLLGEPEVQEILSERGQVEVTCDYCSENYTFDSVDCAEIFASDAPVAVRHQSSNTH